MQRAPPKRYRSSGPGGPHVNKTGAAVLLLADKLADHDAAADAAERAQRRPHHHRVERDNPRRVFKGERFEPAD